METSRRKAKPPLWWKLARVRRRSLNERLQISLRPDGRLCHHSASSRAIDEFEAASPSKILDCLKGFGPAKRRILQIMISGDAGNSAHLMPGAELRWSPLSSSQTM